MPLPPRIRRRRRVPRDINAPPEDRSSLRTVTVPPPPTASENILIEEQQVTRVEELMKRGVRTPNELLQLLDLQPRDKPRVLRWMKKARARWEVMADSEDMRSARHRALAEISQLQQELWIMYQQAGQDRKEKIVILKNIQENLKLESELSGLNKDTVLMLMNESGIPDNVLRDMAKQEELVEVIKAFAGFVEEEQEAYDEGRAGNLIDVTPAPPADFENPDTGPEDEPTVDDPS